jgi:HD-like signal output (HDOD) protein
MAARSIAKRARFPSPDSAFTAGLLHDVGKVILDVYVGAAYDEITRQMQEEQRHPRLVLSPGLLPGLPKNRKPFSCLFYCSFTAVFTS